MTRLDALMIRTLLVPAPRKGALGVLITIAAAIAACEVRTSGMGLQRSDGRTAGIVDPLLMQFVQLIKVALPIL